MAAHTTNGVGSEEQVRQTLESAYDPTKEPPRPLYREISDGEPYPIESLGHLGNQAATKIHEATRAPLEICAQSTLATMTLAAMGHVDVQLPTNEIRPVTEFFATIAASGERKSSADNRALKAVQDFERDSDEQYQENYWSYKNQAEAWEKQRQQVLNKKTTKEAKADALKDLGPKPEAPISPMILTGPDPTIEGLIRLLHEGGLPIAGIFSDEGAQFIGGHAMADDHRLRTAGALSNLWDGSDLRRVRGGDGFFVVKGRRVAVHLLFQPLAAQRMFGDLDLRDQGLLTRFLSAMPPRAAGTRHFIEVLDFSNLSNFSSRVRLLLDRPFTYRNAEKPRDGLKPAVLQLSADARQLWIDFAGHIEGLIGNDRPLDPVCGLANKGAEHAARLAASVAYFEGDCDTGDLVIHADRMAAGITLVEYYLGEALRIRDAAAIRTDITLAEKLLRWLQTGWQEPNRLVSLPNIYQLSPISAIRDKSIAARIVAILEEHGWLERCSPKKTILVNGVPRRQAWRIVRNHGHVLE